MVGMVVDETRQIRLSIKLLGVPRIMEKFQLRDLKISLHKTMADSKLSERVLLKNLTSSSQQISSNKRKREPKPELKIHAEKKKAAKRRKQKKPKEIHDEDLNEGLEINAAFSRMDSRLLADYITQRTLRFGERELSAVELAERHFPGN
jgi:protein CMS1